MPIKVWEYLQEYATEKDEVRQAINEVLDSGWLILGDKVAAFEQAYAAYCGTTFGVGVDNGTNALFLALKALNVGAGDEVITVANTAVPTVSAIVSTGATPVFVDVEQATALMDVGQLESKVTSRTKVLLPVHLYGQCVDMDAVNAVANRHALAVLEDCAQSHGAEYKGRKAGSLGTISATSFYPTKILGTFGDGGMVNTSSEALAQKLKRLRFYGMEKSYYAIEHGYNSRLDELHANILLKKLAHLPTYLARRRALAANYDRLLSGSGLGLPSVRTDANHAYYLYVVRHPARDRILAELKQREILLNVSYPWPIHTMTGYAHLGYKEGDLPVTEALATQIFSLPMYPSLTDEQQRLVVDALHAVLKGL
ncbi:MAG: DegT/DnrJ/EryC1/StrS family aminotransferase [Deltaproteobacteria bacterium]|nr:DegT/DnrJ/EryC1/StrS family aminotransferase [Deltaproteobacteria bacterium]